jgi:probable rRNA maturation factor
MAMLAAAGRADAELSIVLMGDESIRELNRAYRGKDRPTDVLAFAQAEGRFARLAGPLLGDVIVSIPTARRQASTRRRTLLAEVTTLVAHGILHLLGWDHDTAAKSRRMRQETERLCRATRLGAPRRRTSSPRSRT